MYKIIGLAGTNGAGKDTVAEILAEQYNYLFISVSDLLRAEVARRGLPIERENTRLVSTEWRREGGLGVLVDKAYAEYQKVQDDYAGLVVSSIRNPGEADSVHALDGTMLWIDADQRVRYERISSGARGRGGEDNKTFEQFQAEEAAEMQSDGSDAAALDMLAVKAKCDLFPMNDTDRETLQQTIKTLLNL